MRRQIIVLAGALILAPLGAKAAELVVWWNEGRYAEEDEALREIIAAFEQKTGKQVELVFHPEQELPDTVVAAVEAGEPPDFAFSIVNIPSDAQWAHEGRLVDLTDVIGHFSDLFDRDALETATLFDATTGRRGLYLLPVGFATHHVHVWKGLLERAGFALADIPREWESFWVFWCDQVQPALRLALGRDDIWSTGLTMSVDSVDTVNNFWQFVAAYEADYVTRDGDLIIDDPEVRRRLVQAIDSYTSNYRKGCTPPGSVTWANGGNNEAFLTQNIVMTLNQTLDPEHAQGYASAGLRECGDHRLARRRLRSATSDRDCDQPRRCLQGGRQNPEREGVRALPDPRRLARPLPEFRWRAHAAANTKAA